MDPERVLREMVELCKGLDEEHIEQARLDTPESTPTIEKVLDRAERLAQLVLKLDRWVNDGLPSEHNPEV